MKYMAVLYRYTYMYLLHIYCFMNKKPRFNLINLKRNKL